MLHCWPVSSHIQKRHFIPYIPSLALRSPGSRLLTVPHARLFYHGFRISSENLSLHAITLLFSFSLKVIWCYIHAKATLRVRIEPLHFGHIDNWTKGTNTGFHFWDSSLLFCHEHGSKPSDRLWNREIFVFFQSQRHRMYICCWVWSVIFKEANGAIQSSPWSVLVLQLGFGVSWLWSSEARQAVQVVTVRYSM